MLIHGPVLFHFEHLVTASPNVDKVFGKENPPKSPSSDIDRNMEFVAIVEEFGKLQLFSGMNLSLRPPSGAYIGLF